MTLSTLTLMRHAKSSWGNEHLTDYKRTLNDRGNRDAPEMAKRLVARNSIPDVILCSSATRTQETVAHLLQVFDNPDVHVHYETALYLASPDTLINALANVPANTKHVMIVAHNPGIEELSAYLRGAAADTMPTAALRQFECSDLHTLHKKMSTATRSHDKGVTLESLGIKLTHSDYPKSE